MEDGLRGRDWRPDLYQALAAILVASLFFGLSRGLGRARYSAAGISLAIGVPIVAGLLALLALKWHDRSATVLLPILPLATVLFLLPAGHLLRYRRMLAGQKSSPGDVAPVQARLFQDWRNWRGAAPYLLAAIAIPYLAIYLSVEMGLHINPIMAMILACPVPFAIARQKMTLTAGRLLQRTTDRPILYLRSFDDDESIAIRSLLRVVWSVEHDVTLALAPHDPVIAIGRPGERLRPIGAARDYVSDADWQERVTRYIHEARYVVLMVGTTPGLAWEVRRVVELGALHKLLLVVPPGNARQRAARWIRTVSECRAFDGIDAETLTQSALIVGLNSAAEVVVTASGARRAADYYEAARVVIADRSLGPRPAAAAET